MKLHQLKAIFLSYALFNLLRISSQLSECYKILNPILNKNLQVENRQLNEKNAE